MNRLALPEYDALYVISDLHMGGKAGFQIMNRGERLARFVDLIASEAPDARIGLVINGDAIDTLAEEFDGYIAVADAARVIGRIVRDPAFAPVWTALARFVRTPRRRLVFTLGNHDIELALPTVQRLLRQELAGDDEAASGRLEFATEGQGYGCLVGESRVFCTHGNEVDAWNVVDYEALRKLAFKQNAGTRFDRDAWAPNAGTRLVRDVMNSVKRKYPWIDLLKPENNAAIGVLLVMDPGQLQAIQRVLPVVRDRVRGELRIRGLLSTDPLAVADEAVVGRAERVDVRQLLGPSLLADVDRGQSAMAALGGPSHPDVDAILLDMEVQMASGDSLASGSVEVEGTLGWGQMVIDRARGVNVAEALRRALVDWLRDDRTFALADRDHTCEAVVRQVGPEVDFVLTGHTHLARAIVDAPQAYYNTGTWIRLMRLDDAVLHDTATFADVYEVLKRGTLAALDEHRVRVGEGTEPLVMDLTTTARIAARDGSVEGALYKVLDDARKGVRLEEIAGSTFRRH